MHYEVKITGWVAVDAKDADEAEDLAHEEMKLGNLRWMTYETHCMEGVETKTKKKKE